jgi:hypothetical protein
VVYGHGLFVEGLQRVSNLDTRHPPPNASPRIVGDKVMMPADLKRLHKYMLDVEHIGIISDEMRRWSKSYGPSWRTSCRRKSAGVDPRGRWRMSALPPKADIEGRDEQVRFVPLADISAASAGAEDLIMPWNAIASFASTLSG